MYLIFFLRQYDNFSHLSRSSTELGCSRNRLRKKKKKRKTSKDITNYICHLNRLYTIDYIWLKTYPFPAYIIRSPTSGKKARCENFPWVALLFSLQRTHNTRPSPFCRQTSMYSIPSKQSSSLDETKVSLIHVSSPGQFVRMVRVSPTNTHQQKHV